MTRTLCSLASILTLSAVLFPAATLTAQEEGDRPPRWAAWQLYEENDSLVSTGGTDEYYTQGLRFAWIYNPNAVPNPEWTLQQVRRWCRLGLCPSSRPDIAYGHAFGQNFYTPDEISDPNPQLDDRPWAGYLYFSWLVQVTHSTDEDFKEDQPVQNLFELQVGVVGPAAGAEFVQREFHKLIDSPRPLGWKNQIKNEPALNLIYLWRRKVGNTTFDVVPHWGAGLGNVMTYANAGATVRLGHNISSFPQLLITPTNASITQPPPTRTEFYVFVGADSRAIAHNIFLDGNTFRDGPEIGVRKKNFVYDLRTGFAARYKGWRFDYSLVRRSEEFEPRPVGRKNGVHKFGSFTISHTLWR